MKLGEQLKKSIYHADQMAAEAEARRAEQERTRFENRKHRLIAYCVKATSMFEEKIQNGDPNPRVHVGSSKRDEMFRKWFCNEPFEEHEEWVRPILTKFEKNLKEQGLTLGYMYRPGPHGSGQIMYITAKPIRRKLSS